MTKRISHGFTLVEVLIALVVLSIGMLGIAALYLESLRGGRSALYRSQAVTMAADIADRMRANRNPTDAYNCGGECDDTMGGNTQAQTDIGEWLGRITRELPGGTGAIEYTAPTATTPTGYVVTVSWTEVGYTDPLSYALRVEI